MDTNLVVTGWKTVTLVVAVKVVGTVTLTVTSFVAVEVIELIRVEVIDLVRVAVAYMVLLTVEISVLVTVVVPKEEFRFVVGASTTDWTGHGGPVAAMQKDWSFGRTSHGRVMDGF